MRKLITIVTLFVIVATATSLMAQEKPAFTWKDVSSWKYIRTGNSSLSPDGNWLTSVSGPTEGDLTLTLKHTRDTFLYEFPIGASASSAVFSENGSHFAYRESANDKDAKAARKNRKPLYTKLHVVSLADTQKVTFDKIQSFEFSGKNGNWIAVRISAPESAPGAPRNPEAAKGTDLILHNLADNTTLNIGNVSEFSFNEDGNLLAYIIDANEKNGNGVLVRDMNTGVVTALDNDRANYSRLRWNDDGNALALLKGKKDERFKSDLFTALGFTGVGGKSVRKVEYHGQDDKMFPVNAGVSGNGAVYWSDDQNLLFYGISRLEKKEEKKTDSTQKAAKPAADIEKPDVIIWNWQDKRLQSAQQVQESRDKNFSFLSAYNARDNKFVPLADSLMRSVMVGPKQLFAIGYDYTPYEVDNNLSGQTYVDLYLLNLKTGQKTCILENNYQNASRTLSFSPDGKQLAYYREGHYYVMDLDTQRETALTANVPSQFINVQSDHNIEMPATPFMGWTSDSKYVLIQDGYDLWKISADGRRFDALTPSFKPQRIRAGAAFRIYPDDEGIDLKKNQYFSFLNDATKEAGILVLEPGKSQMRIIMSGDHVYRGFQKAKNSNTFVYSVESSTTAPELMVTHNVNHNQGIQMTKNTPDQEKYAWSTGVELIEFVSAHGDTLQATLYLPANYEPGRKYPTITYIYERLTQDKNGYANPSYPGGGFNRAVYTSQGYAVLMPDIKYMMNEPGNSAVACVVPAVEAAIATGVVDRDNIAIHGHSWGGYQTSFLITQTNIFKAAAAGAPLTNMISMYSLIYWNSGSTNQSIFESSQGRFTSGYWDNWDAYKRNSPIYYIKNVETPLLLLHNDKDGAVDYTQGIEYYNGLRRLGKPVSMITYKGENHGIVKEANRKDYAVRMLEFMDHYLKGKPAPDWWEKGIDLLDMQKHLETRSF